MALPDPEKRGAPQLQVGFFPSSHSYNICCNHPKTCSSPRYFHKLRGSLSCGTTFCETPQLFLDASTRCFETIAQAPPGLRICSSLDEALVLVRDLGFGLGKAKDDGVPGQPGGYMGYPQNGHFSREKMMVTNLEVPSCWWCSYWTMAFGRGPHLWDIRDFAAKISALNHRMTMSTA